MLKRVENGQITIPPECAQMVEDEEDEREEGEAQGDEKGH
ncbi:hypothetical protein A2U01_0101920, partial [Trifolium medium]|nr:hypothetical protein [Trifolium medium]